MKLDAVVELVVDQEALVHRIVRRAEEAKAAGQPVRKDDDPEVFKTRLHVYHAQTAPVTEYYRSRGLLNTVDGLRSIDAVTEALDAALKAANVRFVPLAEVGSPPVLDCSFDFRRSIH